MNTHYPVMHITWRESMRHRATCVSKARHIQYKAGTRNAATYLRIMGAPLQDALAVLRHVSP